VGLRACLSEVLHLPARLVRRPTSLLQRGSLAVPVFLSGNRRRIFDFLVDSGSEAVVISGDAANAANLLPAGRVAFWGFGGTSSTAAYLLDEVKVVDIIQAKEDTRHDLIAIVDDRVKAFGVEGFLGLNWVEQFELVAFDYRNRRLVIER